MQIPEIAITFAIIVALIFFEEKSRTANSKPGQIAAGIGLVVVFLFWLSNYMR
jgi:hypothetical protein